MVRTKVFVGNLAFSTKEPELAAAFGAAGKVIGANIITRGPRSLGYGFVEMDSEEDAKKAVELMNKKELNGRQINVEIAKPQEETKANVQGENGSNEEKKDRPRRTRTGPRRRQGVAPESASEEGQGTAEGEGEGIKKRRRTRRTRRPRSGQKRESEEGSPANREESKTTLFVANLPFGLDDEGFAKVVGELGIKAKTAHVVKKRNGRSKGYGFVEFENEADQRKALEGLNKKSVDGRELSVKIALTERPEEGGDEEKKPTSPAEKKAPKPASPAEKKAVPAEKKAVPAEKKAAPAPADKKTASPSEKRTVPAEKKAAAPEKKSTPPAEKKPVEKKDTPAAKETKATDKK